MNVRIKFLCVFLAGSAHPMQDKKKPDQRFIDTIKYTKTQSIKLIAETRYTTHQANLGYELTRAAKYGNHKKLQELISAGAPLNYINGTINGKYETPLFNAARFGRHECLRTLIEAGAPVYHVDELIWRASLNGWPECVFILAKYATLHEKNYALMTAAINNNAKCVQVLINVGANIYHINMCYINTVLVMAAKTNHLSICKLLVKEMLLPKIQKDTIVALLGSRKKGLLNEWNVPRDVLRLIGKEILTASKQANTPKTIQEINKIKETGIVRHLLKYIHQ
jgi:ankyrin repeat protein